MAVNTFYPLCLKQELVKEFLGKSLADVPTPAAVLDLGKVRNNCNRMLEAVEYMGVGWRAHVKTHKTAELTRLQVGDGTGPVNLIVSTIIEAEIIMPLLAEYRNAGRLLLYSFPLTPSSIPRLASISRILGPSGLSIMVDHPSQIPYLLTLHSLSTHVPLVFLKINMGTNRAGVPPDSPSCKSLLQTLLTHHFRKEILLIGLYAHAGHSYASSSCIAALNYLREEFEALLLVTLTLPSPSPSLILSAGATPTTTSIRNLLLSTSSLSFEENLAVQALRATITEIQKQNHMIEMHAGVYPVLDVQQISTHALPEHMLSWNDLAFTVLAEVASIYPGRGENGSTEALIASGSLALGRESCKAYSGWGVLSPWGRDNASIPRKGPEKLEGWVVGRISQEHGILTWSGEVGKEEPLEIGGRVRIWPNHACIAGAGYGWYLVVDGSDEVVDVWPRGRGW